jgi:hypothetical protein
MADRGDWLAPLGGRFDERDGVGVRAQLVGIHGSARKEQRVVILDRGVGHDLVDPERGRRLQVHLPDFDLAVVDREKLGLGAGSVQRFARLLQLDSLDPVRPQDRDILALRFRRNASSQGLVADYSRRCRPRTMRLVFLTPAPIGLPATEDA